MKYFFSACFLLPIIVFAHGGGQTIHHEVGNYTLSLAAVSEQVHVGNAERFNLKIEQKAGTGAVQFSDVWVRITAPTGEFLFSGNLENKESLGLVTGMSYLFPTGGTYEGAVKFFDGNKAIAETSFALLVAEGNTPYHYGYPWQLSLLTLFVGLIMGKCSSLLNPKP